MSRGSSPWAMAMAVLTNPMTAMQAVAEQPRVWPAYLIQSLLMAGAAAITAPKTLELTVQQAGNAPGAALTGGMIGGVIGALAIPWLAGLLVAAVAKLVGAFYERPVPFRDYFAIVGYARIPTTIGTALGSLLVLSVNSFEAMKQMSLSPAVFAPTAPPFVKMFLLSLNPFELWTLALCAIGFAAVHRIQPSKGVGFSAALYLVSFALGMIGLSMMG